MLIYQTYRRVNIPSAFLAYIYLGGVVLMLAVVLPFLALRPNRAHMVPETGVPMTRFLSTEPSFTSSSEHSIEQLVRDCKARHASAPCEYWDWLEVVEGTNDEIFLTTHVDDVVEARRKAVVSRDVGEVETRAAAPWREIASTRFSFYTTDPENTPIRLRQGVVQYSSALSRNTEEKYPTDAGNEEQIPGSTASATSTATVTAAEDRRGGSAVDGWMMHESECELLRNGADFAAVVSIAENRGRPVRRLAGDGDDRFTLVDLLAVADPGAIISSNDGTLHLTTIAAEKGLEVRVNTVVSNVFSSPVAQRLSPLSSQPANEGPLWDAARHFASDLWDAFVPGRTAYFVCVLRVDHAGRTSAEPSDASTRSATRAATLSIFTAPAEWSRVPLLSTDPHHPVDVDTRLLRRATGARVVFRSELLVYRMTAASFLSFLAGSLALLTIPWSVTEFLITYANFRARTTPAWWRAFVCDVPTS